MNFLHIFFYQGSSKGQNTWNAEKANEKNNFQKDRMYSNHHITSNSNKKSRMKIAYSLFHWDIRIEKW